MKTLELLSAPSRGVRFEANAVIFTSAQSLETLNKLARGVTEVEGATAWWLGDIGLHIWKEKRVEYILANPAPELERATREQEAEDFANEYLRGRSEIVGCADGYWANCIALARFFPPDQRAKALTVHHHRAAMIGAGGQECHESKEARRVAASWLFKADEGQWSASELRRQISLSLATHNAPTAPAERNTYEPLDEADKWAMRHREETLNPDIAQKMLTRFQALIEFLDRLKSIAATATHP